MTNNSLIFLFIPQKKVRNVFIDRCRKDPWSIMSTIKCWVSICQGWRFLSCFRNIGANEFISWSADSRPTCLLKNPNMFNCVIVVCCRATLVFFLLKTPDFFLGGLSLLLFFSFPWMTQTPFKIFRNVCSFERQKSLRGSIVFKPYYLPHLLYARVKKS